MAKRTFFGRIERVLLGAVFGVIAFVIERRVLKKIKEGALSQKPKKGMTATGDGKELSFSPDEVHK
jgi:hypothetical protein